MLTLITTQCPKNTLIQNLLKCYDIYTYVKFITQTSTYHRKVEAAIVSYGKISS